MSANKGRNSVQKRKLKQRLFHGRPNAPCCFCQIPLTPASATLEHVAPLSLGGDWHIDNLRLACRDCNGWRGNEDFYVFRDRCRANAPPT